MFAYKIQKSDLLHQQLIKFLPAGRHSNYLHTDSISELTFLYGKGCRLWDADGNEYLDLCGRQGAQFIGHNNPDFIRILSQSFESVVSVNHTMLDLEVCHYLHEHVPCCDKVRFGLSGSEIIENAIRLSRAYTNKSIVIKFKGHYHGSSDTMLTTDKKILPEISWNSLQCLEDFYRTHSDIAAIITEPLCMSSGGIPAKTGYLQALRNFCNRHNIVLIFDEVITGIRTGLGGLQAKYGVTPDLCIYAKGLGNGIPVSALMGKSEIMKIYDEYKVVQGGTYNGHQLGLAAIKATFQILLGMYEDSYSLFEKRCRIMRDLLIASGEKAEIPIVVQGESGCYSINYSSFELTDINQWDKAIVKKNAILRYFLQRFGILTATVCRAYPNIMLDDNDLDFLESRSIAAFTEARKILKRWF